jgi:hypothetical protein
LIPVQNQKRRENNMLKKVLIVSALFLSIVVVSNPVWAQSCPTPDGYYLLDGKLTAKANFPGFVTLSLKLPALKNIEAFAFFDSSGGFSLLLPLVSELLTGTPELSGSWTPTGCSTFAVTGIGQSLIDQLPPGIEATISESFTGTRQSDDTIKGKFNLGVSIGFQGFEVGTITIKGTFTGRPTDAPASVASTGLSLLNPPEQEGSKGSSILADLIIKFLKKIPIK